MSGINLPASSFVAQDATQATNESGGKNGASTAGGSSNKSGRSNSGQLKSGLSPIVELDPT